MAASKKPVNLVSSSVFVPPTAKAPSAPRHLNKRERSLWAALLASNEHLRSPSYRSLVEVFIRALGRHRMAAVILEAEGLVVEGQYGTKVNPAVSVMQTAETTIAALSVKLAISAPGRREAGRHTKAVSAPESGWSVKALKGLRLA